MRMPAPQGTAPANGKMDTGHQNDGQRTDDGCLLQQHDGRNPAAELESFSLEQPLDHLVALARHDLGELFAEEFLQTDFLTQGLDFGFGHDIQQTRADLPMSGKIDIEERREILDIPHLDIAHDRRCDEIEDTASRRFLEAGHDCQTVKQTDTGANRLPASLLDLLGQRRGVDVAQQPQSTPT